MARLSDIIEEFIKDMFNNSDETQLQIGRNDLANHFSCAPSQINYVLTTRFTMDKGYYIESKRGGGGCIIIRKIEFNCNKSLLKTIIDKIGDSITYNSAVQLIEGLFDEQVITERENMILKTIVNDRTLNVSLENKNKLRADILKAVMVLIFNTPKFVINR
ncbi:CtsR family transcriptional regulator [Clostridium luticellarii]|uniref:Transcriptional regulator CtsR n=2 Tax=Clostridium luticellarii TaxID=1691940 RepID=A0A2T0BS23_9CLOT|nr:CtsR family transcriptional regulator [Clostridium luticellarii]MCI1944658.1 CtsR family transcriptional regulator [Clostridium luticellarii]MCI1968155.1 CtsR family transcriptional regulator [Clostridium luticellarii]MCI1995300.1 CtsR family transcriptional regulator [Clostridium luticellarii]PRR86684.1 Transcriptional regulator CtsR [Clostridium luticellarii]